MATQTKRTAGDALFDQINAFETAIAKLRAAIDDITGSTDPETAGWADVARYAHLSDALKRAKLV